MTLDGATEAPENWLQSFVSDELAEDLFTRLRAAAGMVLGRKTYSEFAVYWPQQSTVDPFTEVMNSVRKFVFSASLQRAEWHNTRLINDGSAKAISDLKTNAGGDLHITGSGTFTFNCLRQGLLDEVRVMMCPVVVGSGKRFGEGAGLTGLALADVQQFPRGVLALTYVPAR
jgi:dihydrofolate reductase